jgi:SAM-dependent methyltransferase
MINNSEWFGEWFDSPFYHILYQNRDYKEAERFIGNIHAYLDPVKGSAAVDLACGKGRHAIQLNKLGLDVLGLDLSPQSIEAASQFQNTTLRFAVHDMREGMSLDYPVDYVFNLFTSFGYFETLDEDRAVLHSIEKALKPGGIAVIDYMNCEQVVKSLVPYENVLLGDVDFSLSRRFTGSHIEKKIAFEHGGDSFEFMERVKFIDLSGFKALLKDTGLTLLTTFGDYDLNSFNSETSSRLVMVVKKC